MKVATDMSDTDKIDQMSMDLAEIINNVGRFSANAEISKACYALLVAANELLPLRNVEPSDLRKEDLGYINSALSWSDKARSVLSDLAVTLHEQ